MHVAQSGIFALGTGSHSYLEFDLLEHADPGALVQAIANLLEPRTTIEEPRVEQHIFRRNTSFGTATEHGRCLSAAAASSSAWPVCSHGRSRGWYS